MLVPGCAFALCPPSETAFVKTSSHMLHLKSGLLSELDWTWGVTILLVGTCFTFRETNRLTAVSLSTGKPLSVLVVVSFAIVEALVIKVSSLSFPESGN